MENTMFTSDTLNKEIDVMGYEIINPDQGTSVVRYLDKKTFTIKQLMDGIEMISKKEMDLARAKRNMEFLVDKALRENT
jgi:hypothetical protein